MPGMIPAASGKIRTMGDDPVLLHELWRTRKSGIAPGLAVVLLAVIFLFGTAMGDEAPLKLMIVCF